MVLKLLLRSLFAAAGAAVMPATHRERAAPRRTFRATAQLL
jgi:hypothetical protein